MKSTQYKAWLDRHQLTHEAAGKALGVNKSTSKRYGDGSIKIPLTIELAIEARTVTRKSMTKSRLKLMAPATVKRTVTTPRRKPNAELRTREYLTEAEIDRLIGAAKANRWGHRDSTMILTTYRHGLQVSELVDLQWSQIDFAQATLAVRRVKNGLPSTHPVRGDEMRALRRLQQEQDPKSAFVFTSERGSPFTVSGFARKIERVGEAAGFDFKPHPHMLRHACGFALASNGHDTRALQAYLGHRNIQYTVRYTELSPGRRGSKASIDPAKIKQMKADGGLVPKR